MELGWKEALAVAGAGQVVYGLSQISEPAAHIVMGAACIAVPVLWAWIRHKRHTAGRR